MRLFKSFSFRAIFLSLTISLILGFSQVAAGEDKAKDICSGLVNLKIGSTDIISAAVVPAKDGLPEYCRVMGYVRPSINFELRLPLADWNNKFYLAGCGGYCGNVDTERPGFINACNYGLRRNYAVAAHDSGHWGSSPIDGVWAYNDRQREIDWGYRAVHEVASVSKELIKAFYGKGPAYSYFDGCSNGGRQGAMEAQRYPEDFDGIIIGAPALNMTGIATLFAGFYQANRDKEGKLILDQSKLKLISDAVYKECDEQDGLADGMIADPRKCTFEPEKLLCQGAATENCLTAAQAVTLKKFYSGVKDSSGKPLYSGGMPYGSEPFWSLWAVGKDHAPSVNDTFAENGLRYVNFETDPGDTYSPMDFNFDRDPPKLEIMGKIYNANNPDLSKFKERKGKIILYHGWSDAIVTPFYTVEYFEAVAKKMGGLEQTQDFARLFMVPGMDHCSILPGKGPDRFDMLGALENWVEKSQAPDQILASQLDKDGKTVRTRPLCAYPKVAKYKGSGSMDDGANFICAF
ncbi:MAG: tannase/feruloyl esterase family alpha/beta hydrolase [Candidatus Tectomicrobia bacterium]|uniref:Tannase/feruloyl esterase family alpha/beta hydrolase n=1 Tax=Tectimicrobiota bacterium TaxID=2528274 RepID=A0A933GJU1_UNCTE|nr:tannase/feruloyl esterase family alpha/beta hydrolase [Candidatus Tectomicrobia bacterium]